MIQKLILKPIALAIILSSIMATNAFADNSAIYGWDIKCVGANGEIVTAAQSDDDFYINYHGGKLTKGEVWADTMSQWNTSLKSLVFLTSQAVSPGPDAALSIIRNSTKGFGYGTAIFAIDGTRYNLNCFIRYGSDEDAFDKVSRQPFPAIEAPRALE